ncbi:MAG: 4Fe-4S dicluster domain-containing protein [Xanthomonadaceae bacterium]|nr:4Fe-4S dicluster domain-containing protein [Xanthomonadaceae bacterium]
MASKRIPIAVQNQAGPLYLSESKIYPREVSGRFQRLRVAAVVWLLGMYYLFPWLNWDGRQAVLFDLPARKFYIFSLNFWPQDFFFLALLLIMAGLSLFFFTALAGRLWCGYACPQTVWTEVFLWMEQWTEGGRFKRMKLDAAPWSAEKLLRKGGKHLLWLVFALWTGFTFVGFFTPIRELTDRLVPFQWGGWELFWVLFYSLATWGNAGFLREQVCKYMCPYARFQSAMFDRNTLVIAYDERRGEPRGSRKRGVASVLESGRGLIDAASAKASVIRAALEEKSRGAVRVSTGLVNERVSDPVDDEPSHRASPADASTAATSHSVPLGDCIDCTLCVQVCPTGIDIRNGLQYECIACGACIDACDQVMDKMGYPRGLVRYSTQNAIDGKPSRIWRPRILVYGTLLAALFAGWAWGISQRSGLIIDVLRDRNALYREATDGTIENAYTLKLVNKQMREHRYRLIVEGNPAVRLAADPGQLIAGAEQVLTVPVTLSAESGAVRGPTEVVLVIQSIDDPTLQARRDTRFFAPVR